MKRLLEDLGEGLEISQNLEKTIENALNYYFNFNRDTRYEFRIREELSRLFHEKKNNKAYFFPPPHQFRLRALGFNQILHILIKRLWDEEDFALYSKPPKEINFLELDASDVSLAKVKLEDAIRYVQNLRVIPFIVPEIDFFQRKRNEQIRFCLQWLQKGTSVQNFLNRMKLVGTYIQTIFYGGQNLISLAKEFEKNPGMQLVKEELPNEKLLEDKASLLTKIILSHPLVEAGYFKLSEATLKRTIINDSQKALFSKENLNYVIEILDKSKTNGLKLTDEQIKKTAAKIIVDYNKVLQANGVQKPEDNKVTVEPSVKTEQQSSTPKTMSFDLAHAYDALVYELKAELRKSTANTISVNQMIKTAVARLQSTYPGITEKHMIVIFMYLRDLERKPHSISEGINYMKNLGSKFGISELEVITIYFLMLTEKEKEFLSTSLKDFVENCIEEQGKLLKEKEIMILKSLFGNLPKEVNLNQFYQVKEKLKSRVESPIKKQIIEKLSEYIHVKIAEKKGSWVAEKMIQHGLLPN
jgi:hypothetical protein